MACVSWHDAAACARWRGRLTVRRYRLLSEAEWEYAARSGSTASRAWGEDPGAACGFGDSADRRHIRKPRPSAMGQALARAGTSVGTDCEAGHAHTSPAGAYRGNWLALYDMAGNVWEWVASCWNDSHRAVPVSDLPATGGDCARRSSAAGPGPTGRRADGPHGLHPPFREHAATGERSTTVGSCIARDIDRPQPPGQAMPRPGGEPAIRSTVRPQGRGRDMPGKACPVEALGGLPPVPKRAARRRPAAARHTPLPPQHPAR